MANILAVGIATLDIINTVDGFPGENDEVRAVSQHHQRGGNATNTLVVLSQFEHSCYWAGTLAEEPDSRYVIEDLKAHRINTDYVLSINQGKVPTSYVTLNRQNGSRTIVHYRDLPEFPFEQFLKIDLQAFDWIHFEGRNVAQTLKMLEHVKKQCPHIPCSLEIEKARPDINSLYALPDLLLFSKAYANTQGYDTAEIFLRATATQTGNAELVCGWGEQGAYALVDGQLKHSAAYSVGKTVDTLGAGDTLNAGIIHSSILGLPWEERLDYATRLAGLKCGQSGFSNLSTKFS